MKTKRSYVSVYVLSAVLMLTGCNESRLEDDKDRIDKFSGLFAEAMAPGLDWIHKNAGKSTCEQGIFLSSYQAYVIHALRANVLGHNIDVDRYLGVARKWLPMNGWTITRDHTTDSGSKQLTATNRDVEVDFDLGGYEKAFNLSVAGPCRTIVNWPE